MLQLVWFKRDLRVEDNEPLFRAAERGPVLPLYIVEPDLWAQPDMARRHWDFWREALQTLRDDLARCGQPLVVRRGDAVEVLRDLLQRHPIAAVWSHQETGNHWTFGRDQGVAALLRERAVPWHQPRQHGVVRGAVDRDRWSRQWEALMGAPTLPAPQLAGLRDVTPGELPERPHARLAADSCPGRQRAGRIEARQALHSFLRVRGECYHQQMSSPRTAATACSRLSAHLASGTLSLREVVQQVRRERARLRDHPGDAGRHWRKALAAFDGRLHWHCHFMQKFEREPRVEFENLHSALDGVREDGAHPDRLAAWTRGETGWPLVDACMRALAHSGWINFRMRAMLMSVASYQLWLHWREPALHLARQFVDYEPGIHYPQAQMQSGTTGINTLRIYNPLKQSLDQDPAGVFIRTWIPELEGVSGPWIHAPWRMPVAEQRRSGVRIGVDYPAPLVDHQDAARQARARILLARRDPMARSESRAIYHRHGSRRRLARRPQTLVGAGDRSDDGA